ncbi:MAG: hypothetical protein DI630_14110 [Gordonia sp. (in: high G+C Gram-positive bacteria)]|nr:MAG: hypothetical protein DI630_14110 [Gordonia sp. (in: high G+C Gram-positive bacteria)]
MSATLQLIGERGLHGFSLRDVADRVHMSVGSTTYHFTDRDQLLLATLEQFSHSVVQRCETVVARWAESQASGEQLLESMLDELTSLFADTSASLAQLELYVAASRHPGLATAAGNCITAYCRLIEHALTAAGVDPAAAATRAPRIVCYLDGLTLQSAATATPMALPDHAKTTLWILATADP